MEKIKSLQECKDEVAKLNGYTDWSTIDTDKELTIAEFNYYSDEAAELYAAQFHKQETAEPAEGDLISFRGEYLFTLESKQQWVNRVPDILPPKIRGGETLIWVDKDGYVFERGYDFEIAEQIRSYPCKVYRPKVVSDRKPE